MTPDTGDVWCVEVTPGGQMFYLLKQEESDTHDIPQTCGVDWNGGIFEEGEYQRKVTRVKQNTGDVWCVEVTPGGQDQTQKQTTELS